MMSTLLKAVGVVVTELGEEAVRVTKLCPPILLSPTNLFP